MSLTFACSAVGWDEAKRIPAYIELTTELRVNKQRCEEKNT